MSQVAEKQWNFTSFEDVQNHLSTHPHTQLKYYRDFDVAERMAKCFAGKTQLTRMDVTNDIVVTITSIQKRMGLDSSRGLRFAIVTFSALEKYSSAPSLAGKITTAPNTEKIVSKL